MDDLIDLDISCTHPAAKDNREAACAGPGGAATKRDEMKRRHHAKDGTPGYTLVPGTIETYGRLGKPFQALLRDLADRAASTGACDRSQFLNWAHTEISVRLVKANAKIFMHFVGALSQGVG